MLDLVIAVPALLLVAPLWIVICLLIRATSSGPAIYRQHRVGLSGRKFVLLKFRTMQLAPDDAHREYVRRWMKGDESARQNGGTFKLERDLRVAPVGAFLRKYSLDELPQLLNVIRGQMSLVGPRPAMPYEVSEYEPWHRERLHALPGITGLWQVSGRNQLSFEEMVALDIEYVRSCNCRKDICILLRTIPAVLGGTGH